MRLTLLSATISLASLYAHTAAFVTLDPFPDILDIGGTYTLSWTGSANYSYTLWLVVATAAENNYAWRKVLGLAEDLQFSSLNGSYAWTVPSNFSTLGEYGLWLDALTLPFDGTSSSNMTEYFTVSSPAAPTSSTIASITASATPSTILSSTSSATSGVASSSSTSGALGSTPNGVHHDSLSGGAIAGIVIGILAFVALLVIGAVMLRKRRRVLALRKREATARADRLSPVMQEGDVSYEMENSRRKEMLKDTSV